MARGVAPSGSRRTRRDSLPSPGSHHLDHQGILHPGPVREAAWVALLQPLPPRMGPAISPSTSALSYSSSPRTRRGLTRRNSHRWPSPFARLPLQKLRHYYPGRSAGAPITPGAPSQVPCESRRPGSCRLNAGHRSASNRDARRAQLPQPGTWPRFRCPFKLNDTSTAVRVHSSSWSPPDASCAPFPHRSPRRSSANAACGGLASSPEGRCRRANLHLSHSTSSQRSAYIIRNLRSPFMAHVPALLTSTLVTW